MDKLSHNSPTIRHLYRGTGAVSLLYPILYQLKVACEVWHETHIRGRENFLSVVFSSVGVTCTFDGAHLSRDEIVLHITNYSIGWQYLGNSAAGNL